MTVRGFLVVAFLIGGLSAAPAEPIVLQETSPEGVPYRRIVVSDQPMQTIQFAWPDPSPLTSPGKEALAFLGPALVLEGPEGLSPSAMIEELRDMQAGVSLSNSGWRTRGAVSAPVKTFAAAANLLKRTLTRPSLSATRLRARQANALARLRQGQENPETIARRTLTRLILGDSPLARLANDDGGGFERVSREDIAEWARATFVRAGLDIVVAGPMGAEEVGGVVDDLFASMPQGEARAAPPQPPLRAPGKLVVIERPVVQTVIAMAGPTSLPVDEHAVRGDMLASILGGGLQSRMYRSVRERLGAAYGLSASLSQAQPNVFALSIRAMVANDRAKEALDAMRQDYATFVRDGVAAEEVDPQRVRFATSRSEALRRPSAVASIVLSGVLNGAPDDAIATYAERIKSYPLAAFNADLRSHFPRPPLATVVVAPSAEGWGADCVIKGIEEADRCD